MTDVKVKAGAEVAGGDVLAAVEAEDVMLDIKSKELEMLKMENALEQYREGFDESSHREELERLSKAEARAQKDLDSSKALYESGGGQRGRLQHEAPGRRRTGEIEVRIFGRCRDSQVCL